MAMTQAQTRANGLVIPSLPQHWLTAMLHVFVELVLGVVSTCRMRNHRQPRDWHTGSTMVALPEETSDTDQETEPAAASGLNSISSFVPQAMRAIHLPLLGRWRQRNEGELPPLVRKAGGIDAQRRRLRALARKTAGAAHATRKSLYSERFAPALT